MKHPRIHWFIASFGAFLVWVAIYLLVDQLPMNLEFSIWQPKELFSTPLILSMDDVAWPLVMGISGVLLIISLTSPARDFMVTAQERISVLIYTCLCLAAVLAGNVLSVVTSWMLMDVFIFVLSIRESDSGRRNDSFMWWFGKNLIAIVLLILAAVINISIEGDTPIYNQVSTTSLVIIIFSSLIRMPFPLISQHAEEIGWVDPGNKSTLDLFPMITGLAVIARVLDVANPEEGIVWFYLIGGLLIIGSLIQMIFYTHEKRSILFLNLGVTGIGILLASYGEIRAGILISAIGVIILGLNAWIKFLSVHERWHYVVPILLAAILAGLTGSPGCVLSHVAVKGFLIPGSIGIDLFIGIGMGLLGVLFFGLFFKQTEKWKSAENLTITSYSLGLMLFASNMFLIGFKINPGYSVAGILFFLSTSLFIGFILYCVIRTGFQLPVKFNRKLKVPAVLPKFNFLRVIGEGLINVISTTGKIFEGETGLLWAFVILLLLILTLGGIG
jgi:hypothetical protein